MGVIFIGLVACYFIGWYDAMNSMLDEDDDDDDDGGHAEPEEVAMHV